MDKDLGVISVATPCSESWEQMKGDAQVRFCGKCEKNVYSLDALTADEVRALVVRTEGKVCWRFFVRKDGTVLTKDCPVGLRRLRQRTHAAIAASVAIVLASAAGLLRHNGFWNASQCVGSWSARLKQTVQTGPLLRSTEARKQVMLGGM